MGIKLALAQFAPRLGDVKSNLACMSDLAAQALSQRADLVVFPELALTGYFLKDLVTEVAARPTPDDPFFAPLLDLSGQLDLVVSFVEEDERRRYYISAAYLTEGRVAHVHRKVYLPTYRMFDDARFFAAGDSFRSFTTRWGRMGIMICEDAWHLSSPYVLWMDGADFLIDVAAGPGYGIAGSGNVSTAESMNRLLGAYAEMTTTFVVFCNRVGMEDGIVFAGGSRVVGPDGAMIASAPSLEPALVMADMETDALRRSRLHLPLLRDEKLELVRRELGRIARRELGA